MKYMVWFDMDGTLNRFYEVPDWLPKLRASDPSPYAEAKVNLNMSLLARYIHKLQAMEIGVGIISWAAMDSSPTFKKATAENKDEWLGLRLPSVQFDAIHITDYGVPKQEFMRTPQDILFDDNPSIRDAWTGTAYPPEVILQVLKEIIHNG